MSINQVSPLFIVEVVEIWSGFSSISRTFQKSWEYKKPSQALNKKTRFFQFLLRLPIFFSVFSDTSSPLKYNKKGFPSISLNNFPL